MTGSLDGVSVVIPAFDAEAYIEEALASVLAQSLAPVEVVVVDDGSRDGTAARAAAVDPRVRVLRQENRGVSAARNAGVSAAQGAWVAFLDADDAWEPTKLEEQMAVARDPSLSAVHCGATLMDAQGRATGRVLRGRGGMALEDLLSFRREVCVTGGSGLLVRRSTLDEVGGFYEGLSTSADWDLYRRLAASGPLGYVDSPLVRYRLHEGQMHRDLGRFRRDMTVAMQRAVAAHPTLRRRAWGGLYRVFAGSEAWAGHWLAALGWGARSVWSWPPEAAYLLGFPRRALARWRTSTERTR